MKRNNCMYLLPKKLTGKCTICGLFFGAACMHGTNCVGYTPHTKESKKALAEAIADKIREAGARNENV